MNRCVFATVLEKESKAKGFINVFDVAGNEVEVFGGVYMKINPSNFAAVQSTDSVIEETVKQINEVDTYPVVAFPFFSAKNASSATPVFDVFDVPVGTRITMRIDFQRNGGKSVLGNQCDRKNYILEKTFTASRDYGNMAEWFNGDNISTTLNSGIEDAAGTETINNEYLTPTNSVAASPLGTTTGYSANKSATEIANANYIWNNSD